MIGFFKKIKDRIAALADSFYVATPAEKGVVHCGVRRKDDICFKKILIVDDIPQYAQNSLEVIKGHYVSGEVFISMAYTFRAAFETFNREKNDLVILDMDLQDIDGDGCILARKFIQLRPDTVILANSKKKKYNTLLLKAGAVYALGKRKERLRKWLLENEPL